MLEVVPVIDNESPEIAHRPPAVVTIHRSSAKDRNVGWTVSADSDASQADVDRAVGLALMGHRRVEAALLGSGGTRQQEGTP
jgi:hypothetical protein